MSYTFKGMLNHSDIQFIALSEKSVDLVQELNLWLISVRLSIPNYTFKYVFTYTAQLISLGVYRA